MDNGVVEPDNESAGLVSRSPQVEEMPPREAIPQTVQHVCWSARTVRRFPE